MARRHHQPGDHDKDKPIEHDGYNWGEELAWEGWAEWKKTGRRPNPYELRRRLVPSFNADMDAVDELIESQRPEPPKNPRSP